MEPPEAQMDQEDRMASHARVIPNTPSLQRSPSQVPNSPHPVAPPSSNTHSYVHARACAHTRIHPVRQLGWFNAFLP